ncbi:MAG TPA: glycosyltransferase [Blastocatellia bacterium]|nr:glycosyltransferase [Blastocatellia bacterium]
MGPVDEHVEISVAISTYNRCGQLRDAIQSLLAQDAGNPYEILVVDNNSNDDTRAVVHSLIERGHSNLRYIFEERQGLSYGRNTAIANARAPLIAFTDDDVRVAPNWISTAIQAFRDHPDVDFIGGKVIPRWQQPPPDWLTEDHWAPLAVLNYGDYALYVDPGNPVCLVGANLLFRKSVFDRIGLFSPELQRVKDSVGSMEDHELIARLWRAGGRGLYVPEIVVYADVPAERMSKAYHRRWHAGHGCFYAIARIDPFDDAARGRLLDVPLHAYRQFGADAAGWIWNCLTRKTDQAFLREVRLRFLLGFLKTRFGNSRVPTP